MLFQWILSLPMMVCFFWGIFFLVRCLQRNGDSRVNVMILLFYLASTTLYTNHWLFFSDAATPTGAWTYLLANLSVYPLYYAYLRALTRARRSYEVSLLLVPAVLLTACFVLNMLCAWFDKRWLLLVARICFGIQVLWVWIRGFQLLRKTQSVLDNSYSDDRIYLLHPTHILLWLLGITAAFSTLLNILGRDTFSDTLIICIPAVAMSALLYSIGYVAAHTTMPLEADDVDLVAEEPLAADKEVGADDANEKLMQAIENQMREEKLFTNERLTIHDLSAAVNSNRTYVSHCINSKTGLSFSQYVARYRVEQAKAILCDLKYTTDKEAVAAAIALSGFASDQTFYRLFKEIIGTTPLQFRHRKIQD